jgi:hypothetical protein
MDAAQQAQLAQSNAAKQTPPLTAEQVAQQKAMQEAMAQQQQQLQAHINAEIQKGVQFYNLDVQRFAVAAQALKDLVTTDQTLADISVSAEDLLRIEFVASSILSGIERSLGINTLSTELPATEDVSHETIGSVEADAFEVASPNTGV